MRYLARVGMVLLVLILAVSLTLWAGLPYSSAKTLDNPYYGPALAVIDITPDTLQLDRKAKWVSAQITVPGYDPRKVDTGTVRLEGVIPAEVQKGAGPQKKGEKDSVTVKFRGDLLIDLLEDTGRTSGSVELTVTGFVDDTFFEGSDEVFVVP